MYICDFFFFFGGGGGGGGGDNPPKNFYHSCLYIKIQEQYTLEQYYYIRLYRQQILAVWLGME